MNYCKLYVDTDHGIDYLRNLIAEINSRIFGDAEVFSAVYNNDVFSADADIDSELYPIERSRYYVEIDSEPGAGLEEKMFHFGIASLVNQLRLVCEYVVASCDFEDYIVQETGWN